MSSSAPKTILISGASKGIGKLTAELFASRGWNVAAAARSIDNVSFDDPDDRIAPIHLDVTDQAMVKSAVRDVIEKFGRLDAIVNNAGFGSVAPFETMSEEEVRAHFETNVFGALNLIREVLPHMRENGGGRIINVTSICGRMTLPLMTAYCATKWALDGFSEALSFEVKSKGIKVKIIEPGVFRTDFFRTARTAPPSRIPQPAYDEYVKNVLPNLAAWEEKAPPPDRVAQSIWTAANDIWPRLRYHPRGFLTVMARGLVPGNLYVRAVRRLMNAW